MKRMWNLIAAAALVLAAAQASGDQAGAARVVHCPKNVSLGALRLYDAQGQAPGRDWWDGGYHSWAFLAEAKGDVTVPAGKTVALDIESEIWDDPAPMQRLHPNDVDILILEGAEKQESVKPGDAFMPQIARLTGLRMLCLISTDIGNEALAHLAALTSLNRLYVSSDGLDDAGFGHIGAVKSLTGLRIYSGLSITASGLAHLARLENLAELQLGAKDIANAGLAHLAALPKLERLLFLSHTLTDEGYTNLARILSLKDLYLICVDTTPSGLARLAEHPSLESLRLNRLITDEGVQQIAKMSSLKRLQLQSAFQDTRPGLTDKGFEYLGAMKGLEQLEIVYSGTMTPNAAWCLASLQNLRRLSIPNFQGVTDDHLVDIGKLNRLEELRIRGEQITDAGLKHLEGLSALKKLVLLPKSKATPEGIARLRAAIPTLTYIGNGMERQH